MMLKKNPIILLLCSAFFAGGTAYAEKTEISENSETVTVTEEAGGADGGMIIVAKSGADIDDNDNIFAMEYIDAVDGKLVFKFDMQDERNNEASDGEYDIYIRRLGVDTVQGKMTYASAEKRMSVMNSISEVKSGDDVLDILNNVDNTIALKALGCDMDGFLNAQDKSEVADFIYEGIKSEAELDSKTFSEKFNISIIAESINAGGNAEENLIAADFEFEGVSYSKLTDNKLKKWICDSISDGKPYDSVAELKESYGKAVMLYNIKESRLSKFEDTLGRYADALGIDDDSAYKKYKKISSKDSVNENILDDIKKKTLLTVDGLVDIISDNLEESGKKGSGGSSGGGGGSSGGTTGVSKAPGVSVAVPTDNEPVVSTAKFADMNGFEWASEAVNAMAEKNVISGTGNGNFEPDGFLTREAFVKMLVLATGFYDENAKCNFSDVPENAWYYSYIASAVNSGLVSGISDTEFGVGRNISRQDMAVLCGRYIKNNKSPEKIREKVRFSDESQISDYAIDAVYELYQTGIINGMGDNSFNPLGTATRAQGAVIIYNLVK